MDTKSAHSETLTWQHETLLWTKAHGVGYSPKKGSGIPKRKAEDPEKVFQERPEMLQLREERTLLGGMQKHGKGIREKEEQPDSKANDPVGKQGKNANEERRE